MPHLTYKNIWDEKLVEKYLAINPERHEMYEILRWPPLYRSNNRKANKHRGWIPHPEHRGYMMWDPEYLKTVPSRFNHAYEPISKHEPGKIWEFEKMVIDEARGRMQAMEATIKKYSASEIKLEYKVIIDDKQKKKNLAG